MQICENSDYYKFACKKMLQKIVWPERFWNALTVMSASTLVTA